jgi:polyhydroxybutyrate depolymerase
MLWLSLLIAACSGTAPAATSSGPSFAETQITVGRDVRSYVLFRPSSLGTKPAPLVIVMHGYTQGIDGIQVMTGFSELASKVGFVVAYPRGTSHSWNAGTCCGHNTNDDVAFIKALIDKLVQKAHVDPKRVFATGMSNGGMMSNRLGCEITDQLAAVASVSGSLLIDSCHPSRPISVLEMHGIDDHLVPYEGGQFQQTTFPPTMSVMKQWANINGCGATPTTKQSGPATTYSWTACRDGASVVLYAIAGGGHEWFHDPDATQVVWDFFSGAPAR